MPDVVCFRVPPPSADDASSVQPILAGHLDCERLAARRQLLTTLLALLSAPVWAMAVWPQLLEGPDRRFLLYLFGFLLALCAWAVVEEWRATGRLRRSLAEVADASDEPVPGASVPAVPAEAPASQVRGKRLP